MDLLFSLGLGDNLPEQSTRLTSHPGVARALDRSQKVCLGFDSCLNCGSQISAYEDNVGSVSVSNGAVACEGCQRVRYCSMACRKADSEDENLLRKDGNECEPAAVGHSPVICALLNLCNDDEAAEDDLIKKPNASEKTRTKNGKANQDTTACRKREAARYRLQTEMESYPATLFNILAEAPSWFGEAMTRRLRHEEDVRSPDFKRRRGKRDRSYNSPAPHSDKERQRKRELALHIVGASSDSELWGWDGTTARDVGGKDDTSVLSAYAEASMNLLSYVKNVLEASISIRCIFVGPDCPASSPCRVEVPIPDSRSSILTIETHCCNYGDEKQPYLPCPDAIVFFNPGFSCTDYDWSGALAAVAAYQLSSSSLGPTPFIIATNTEMEGYADIKHLLDRGYLDERRLPEDILEVTDSPTSGDQSEETFFFGKNPYVGLRVRQSGTLGNDLFVKNRWVLAGLFSNGRGPTPSKKRKKALKSKQDTAFEDNQMKQKKHRGEKQNNTGCRNSKRKNPALI